MARWDLVRAMARYEAKIDGTTLQGQLVTAKPQMVANYETDSTAQYLVEGAIQTAMATTGTLVSSLLTSAYMSFGKAILRITRRYSTNGTVRAAQCQIELLKAVARGLNNNIGNAIITAVCDIVVAP